MLTSHIFWRIFLNVLLAVFMSLGLSFVFDLYVAQLTSKKVIDQQVSRITELSDRVAELLFLEEIEELKQWIEQEPEMNQQFLVFDRFGDEILGRDRPPPPVGSQLQFIHSLSNEFNARGEETTLVVESIFSEDYVIEIHPQMKFSRLYAPTLAGRLIRFLLLFLLSFVFSYFLARRIALPIKRLQLATRFLQQDHLSHTLPQELLNCRDEMGDLSRDFASMTQSLEASRFARQQLLSDVSHELRSPLARMQVALELMRDQPDSSMKQLNRMDLEIQRMNDLIENILHFQRLQLHQQKPIETFDVLVLLRELHQDICFEYQHSQQRFILNEFQGVCLMEGNRMQIRSAIENIVRNAAKYNAVDGEVHMDCHYNDECVSVCIQDEGPGVQEANIAHIIEPFARADASRARQTGGFGLGLSIAHAIIEAHQGKLMISNRMDRSGLSVCMTLPRQITLLDLKDE